MDRNEIIKDAKDHAFGLDGDPTITICQGPPICLKQFADGEDVDTYTDACPWCERLIIHQDGTETVVKKPSRV